MSAAAIRASLVTDKQALVMGVIGFAAAWYIRKKSISAAVSVGEMLFGPELGPDVELTKQAENRRDEYVKAGYMSLSPGGVYRITPLGEIFIKSGGSL